jgi:hypothetical protein
MLLTAVAATLTAAGWQDCVSCAEEPAEPRRGHQQGGLAQGGRGSGARAAGLRAHVQVRQPLHTYIGLPCCRNLWCCVVLL